MCRTAGIEMHAVRDLYFSEGTEGDRTGDLVDEQDVRGRRRL